MRIPEDVSETGINRLVDDGVLPVLNAETVLSGRVNEINLTARQYDIETQYLPDAPPDERWRAVDMNTFDGSPEGVGSFQGYGASQKEARLALLDLFAAYDAEHGR